MAVRSYSTKPIPVTATQVEAAGRVHSALAQWTIADSALEQLKSRVPGFSVESSLLKTVALNELYATRVLATGQMARHIANLMAATPLEDGSILVEHIAALPNGNGGKTRRFTSFAAKFCHFFVDDQKYPIYDDAARKALALHLGPEYRINAQHPYQGFCENLAKFSCALGSGLSYRTVDRYLWLTGMYMRWLDQREDEVPRLNAELRQLFEAPNVHTEELNKMLPLCLERTFTISQDENHQ